jgi:hypothetical protein
MSEQTSGGVIQAGSAVKVAAGTLNIQFPRPFASPPVVVVGSVWQSPGFVGNVDGIQSISSTGFVVNSANASPDYFINWIAYGTM